MTTSRCAIAVSPGGAVAVDHHDLHPVQVIHHRAVPPGQRPVPAAHEMSTPPIG
ncbi:hypothetical protein [Actinoallomurus sp. CA-142502]|uniref:hypothetical protein n=1 Tax=Actinoallomurus sp. CA-142502 TaxID=3239885 RepID=UPI003D8B65EF